MKASPVEVRRLAQDNPLSIKAPFNSGKDDGQFVEPFMSIRDHPHPWASWKLTVLELFPFYSAFR